jgi:hypothetical protein
MWTLGNIVASHHWALEVSCGWVASVSRLARARGCVAALQAVLDAGGLDAIVAGLRCEDRPVVRESMWAGANLCEHTAAARVPQLCASDLLSALAGGCGLRLSNPAARALAA